MNKKTFGETLRSLREREKLSVKAVIEELKKYNQDITDKTLYSYENDKRAASADMLLALCQIYNCSNILETFAGIAPDYSIPDDQEWKIIEKYRSLDPHGQDMVDTVLVKEYERVSKYGKLTAPATIIEFHPKQDNNLLVLPYFRAGVSAGTGIFILGNEAEDDIELPALPEYETADFAIDVNGDSMEPDFSHEDIALVQRDAEMHIGDIGVFIVNGDAFIKELGEKELISRNKDYKNIPIHEGDNVVCMGKVIGKVMY